jgi:hypothetical protein
LLGAARDLRQLIQRQGLQGGGILIGRFHHVRAPWAFWASWATKHVSPVFLGVLLGSHSASWDKRDGRRAVGSFAPGRGAKSSDSRTGAAATLRCCANPTTRWHIIAPVVPNRIIGIRKHEKLARN